MSDDDRMEYLREYEFVEDLLYEPGEEEAVEIAFTDERAAKVFKAGYDHRMNIEDADE